MTVSQSFEEGTIKYRGPPSSRDDVQAGVEWTHQWLSSPVSMVLLGFLALALFIGSINSTKLQLLSTKNAIAYANSVAENSSPAYAIDEEVSVNHPTCFRSRPGHLDPDNFNWLAVDLGIVTWNITEVYLVLNSNTTDISDLEVFVTTRMHSAVHYSGEMNGTAGLPWHAYSLCGSTTSDYNSATSATVRCTAPLHGRWLLVRRHQQPLQVCLLAVYVRKENRCFKPVDLTPSIYARANEFRLERHTSLEQCRESCAETPSCQGLAFSKQSRRHSTGLCRLFRGSTDIGATDDTKYDSQLISCEGNCRLEQNECNLGRVFPLIRIEEEDGTNEDDALPIVSIWRIEEPKDLADETQLQKTLFALRFNGRITCEAESCGEVLVVLVDGEGEERICSSIDTDLVSVLDRYTIRCHNAVTTSDTVAIKLIPSVRASSTPKLQITNGHARFLLTESNESQSFSTHSILPEELRSRHSEPLFTAFPIVEYNFFTTENSNDQLETFGVSTESSHEGIDTPSDTLLSTTVEEISSIPFESTEYQDVYLPDTASSMKSKGVQKSADSAVFDKSVSVAEEDFLQLSDLPVDSNISPQPNQVTSTPSTLPQARNALKTAQVQPPNPLQNDAEVLPQEMQNASKEAKVNATLLNLLTAGTGSNSITNLVMTIVIVSIVVLVAIAAAVWFFCVHGK
ncbi:hypothetical protein TcWFU_008697 [Taenia crassiceps]|uniref:Apple domain-containing protein n=1 Tax=Taenia crassiceps TaxID=6207 RepID=A0ABR4Q9J5_9CEST